MEMRSYLEQRDAERARVAKPFLGTVPLTWEEYGLNLGDRLTDWPNPTEPPMGLWRVDVDGLTDMAGGDDWDWQGLADNGGLGTLHKLTVRAN